MKQIYLTLTALLLFQCVGAQQNAYSIFDEQVLKKVKDAIATEGGIDDGETLYKKISAGSLLNTWVNAHTAKSQNLLTAAVLKKRNEAKFIASAGTDEKTKHVFFDRTFFESVPAPDLSAEIANGDYKQRNSGFYSDKDALQEQAKTALQEHGVNEHFHKGSIPLEGDGPTEKMFLVRSSKDGSMISVIEELHYRMLTGNKNEIPHEKVIVRPLRDKAMLLEKKYWYSGDETSYIMATLEEESRFFEETIVAWSPKADFYAATEAEKNSKEAAESEPYTISRAILLRMCQERITYLENKFWHERVKGLANLSAETASVFAAVNWNNAVCKKASLSNPVIQMAQRASTIEQRLDALLFEASLLENKSKLIYKTFGRMMGGV